MVGVKSWILFAKVLTVTNFKFQWKKTKKSDIKMYCYKLVSNWRAEEPARVWVDGPDPGDVASTSESPLTSSPRVRV